MIIIDIDDFRSRALACVRAPSLAFARACKLAFVPVCFMGTVWHMFAHNTEEDKKATLKTKNTIEHDKNVNKIEDGLKRHNKCGHTTVSHEHRKCERARARLVVAGRDQAEDGGGQLATVSNVRGLCVRVRAGCLPPLRRAAPRPLLILRGGGGSYG